MATVMSHTHLQYVCNKSTKFQFNPPKTVRRVDHTKIRTVFIDRAKARISSVDDSFFCRKFIYDNQNVTCASSVCM